MGMLAIGRRFNEAVIVRHKGETLKILLIDRGSRRAGIDARLAFDGPRSFEILREELVRREDREHAAMLAERNREHV